MNAQPHLLFIERDGAVNAFYALHLDACIQDRDSAGYPREFLRRWQDKQAELMRGLHSMAGHPAYALRIIVRPDASAYSSGSVEIFVFGRVAAATRAEAAEFGRSACQISAALFSGALPYHVWRVVTDATLFNDGWKPLDFSSAHFCGLKRRERLSALGRAHRRARLGKRSSETRTIKGSASNVYCAEPFEPRPNTLAKLLRILLLHPETVVYQAALEPTSLTPPESAALEEEIAKCEQLYQRPRGAFEEALDASKAAHIYRADQLRRLLDAQMLKLEEAAFQISVLIASTEPISPLTAEIVGAEVFGSQSRTVDDTSAMQSLANFEMLAPNSAAEKQICRCAFESLDTAPWGRSCAPPNLKRIRDVFGCSEAAGVFRFPVATGEGLHGLRERQSRVLPLPRELARLPSPVGGEGPGVRGGASQLMLGENHYLGLPQKVFLNDDDRNQHLYMVGQTGTGKTTLMKSMIIADIRAGHGMAVVDPHGDLFNELLELIPPGRAGDVVLLDPTDSDFPAGINLLEYNDVNERHYIAREMKGIMERLMADQYGQYATNMTGPVFYQHMQMNLLLAMSNPDDPGTLVEFYEIYQKPDFWKKWYPLKIQDQQLERWVTGTLKGIDYQKKGAESVSMGDYVGGKFTDFILDPRLRLIFGQKKSTINFRQIMDEGKILLINLAKGPLTEANARFMGMILMTKIQAAAMSRVELPAAERRRFLLYVDEFQSLATEGFIVLLSEARKFGIALVLANQFIAQIEDKRIMQSIFGNVGTLVAMRVGQEDAGLLETQFAPSFDRLDLCNLPNWEACVKTKFKGQVVPPFSMHTLTPPDKPNRELARDIRALSRASYGRPRAEVLDEISRGLNVEPPVQQQ